MSVLLTEHYIKEYNMEIKIENKKKDDLCDCYL